MDHKPPTINPSGIAPQCHATIGFLRRGYSSTGGAEAYLTRLAEGLLSQGYRVVLLGTGDWPQEAWPGEDVVILPHRSLREFAAAALAYKKEKKIDLLFSLERVPGCDIFRAGDGVHAAWLERRADGLSFFKKCCLRHFSRHREVLALEERLYGPSVRTHVIANSQMVADEIENYFGFPQKQITIIRNGVPLPQPLSREEHEAARDHFKMQKGECVLLFVGSGWERKGLKVALKGVERAITILKQRGVVPNMKLWVAGKGAARRYHSPYIHFLGPIKKISLLYAAADLFILPTLYDPFSNASLEALAGGLPVITTRCNGCSEIIEEEIHGSILDDPRDVEACAAALVSWYEKLQQPSKVEIIRNRCAALGAEFSTEKNLQATMAVIARVLERQRASEERQEPLLG